MLKRNFAKIPDDPELAKDLPLVGALSIRELRNTSGDIELPPIVCEACGVVLVDHASLNKEEGRWEYTCEFCGHANVVPENVMNVYLNPPDSPGAVVSPGGTDYSYVIARPGTGDETKTKLADMHGTPGEGMVACIDISGSMSGGKIKAVKHALVETIRDIKVNQPKTYFSLVTFHTDLEIYATPASSAVIPDGDVMHSEDLLDEQVTEITTEHAPKGLGEFGDKWIALVEKLRDKNMTALGPALVASMTIARNLRLTSTKIILLTDGLANVGVGRIEGSSSKRAEEFYDRLAKKCLGGSIIVDVIGVQDSNGGNQVALNVIGRLSDVTGGEMFFITAQDIDQAFGSITSRQYAARDAVLRVYTPPEIELDDISGVWLGDERPKKGEPIKLGALDENRELYLNFKAKGKPSAKKVPIQVQMEYMDENNEKRLRVVKQEVEVGSAEDFKVGYDPTLASNMVLQEASKAYSSNDLMGAKQRVKKMKEALSQVQVAEEQASMYSEAIELLEDEEEEWDMAEQEMDREHVADKGSFRAARAQKMYRMDIDSRKKRLEAKKKK